MARQRAGDPSQAWRLVEEHIEAALTFSRLPRRHHKHLTSTHLLARRNEEIKRRTHVVRSFPNAASCLRLVRALAVEMHEHWLEAHRYLPMDDLREHEKEARRLAAREQPNLPGGQPCALPASAHHRHHDPFCRFWTQLSLLFSLWQGKGWSSGPRGALAGVAGRSLGARSDRRCRSDSRII